MSDIHFSFVRDLEGNETIVLLGRETRILPDTHANFARVRTVLLDSVANGTDLSEDALLELADTAAHIRNTFRKLSDRVTLDGDTVLFDGDPVESKLTEHIVNMIQNQDDNWIGYVAFLENLSQNPSKKSRKHLFEFLNKHDLVITEDGCLIGYKGIAADGLSKTSGAEDVTVTTAEGVSTVHRGRIPNPVGATVEIARSLVDEDRNVTCSVGLHIANHSYADSWGGSDGLLVTVKVNPRDVVSVPKDSNDQKIRSCRYTVLESNETRERIQGTSYITAPDDENDEDADDDGYYSGEECYLCGGNCCPCD